MHASHRFITYSYRVLLALIPLIVCLKLFPISDEIDVVRFGLKMIAGAWCLLTACTKQDLNGFHPKRQISYGCVALLIVVIWSDVVAGTLFSSDVSYAVSILMIAGIGGSVLRKERNLFTFALVYELVTCIAAIDYYCGSQIIFDNKAGYTAFFLISVPLWWHTAAADKQWKTIVCLCVTCLNILLVCGTGLRGGWLALVVAGILSWTLYRKPHAFTRTKKLALLCTFGGVIMLLIYGFYLLRPLSADGRFLIYECTARLGWQSPLWGWGSYAMLYHYMSAQAEVLSSLPFNDTAQTLADNTYSAFNLPLDIFVRYGFVGLSLSVWLIWKLYKQLFTDNHLSLNNNPCTLTAVYTLTAILTLSLTSYPLSYPIVFVVVALIAGAYYVPEDYSPKRRWRAICLIIGFGLILEGMYTYHKEYSWYNGDETQRSEMLSAMRHRPELIYNHAASLNAMERYEESEQALNNLEPILRDYDTELLHGDNALWMGETLQSEKHLQVAHHMIPSRFTPLYGLLQLYSETDAPRADSIANDIIHKPIKIPSPEVNRIRAVAHEWLKHKQQ